MYVTAMVKGTYLLEGHLFVGNALICWEGIDLLGGHLFVGRALKVSDKSGAVKRL